jgi:hypothetical protein
MTSQESNPKILTGLSDTLEVVLSNDEDVLCKVCLHRNLEL